MNVNVLLLTSSIEASDDSGKRFCPALAEARGASVIEMVVANAGKIPRSQFIVSGLEADLTEFRLDSIITLLLPGSFVVSTKKRTAGSLCTALLAAAQLNQSDELLIISMNELLDISYVNTLKYFRERACIGGILTFESVHPRYSFARLDDYRVTEVSQHEPISMNATTGSFWFRTTGDFVTAAKASILKGRQAGGRFYIGPAYNELILERKTVGAFKMEKSRYFPLKNEHQINDLTRVIINGN